MNVTCADVDYRDIFAAVLVVLSCVLYSTLVELYVSGLMAACLFEQSPQKVYMVEIIHLYK